MPEAAKRQATGDIEDSLAHGRLQHRVARRVPLAEIAHAPEQIERRTRGVVIVDC